MSFIIQYSHSHSKRWFGFGADAVKPPTEFTLEEAKGQLSHISKNYKYLMSSVRIVNKETQEVVEEREL